MMNFVRKMLTERCLMVIDKKFAILFVILTGLFCSCTTTVKYKVSRPAKLSTYGIQTIAVLPYEPKSEKSTSASPQAVYSMEKLYNRICTTIVNENYCSLVDSTAFKEAESKAELCDAYITFSVSQFYVYENFYLDDGSIYQWSSDLSKKSFYNIDDYGRALPVPLYVIENSTANSAVQFSSDTNVSRHVDMMFSYNVIDSSTNKVIAMEDFVISADSDEYKFGSVLPEASSIIENQLNIYVSKIVSNFQPYTEDKANSLISDSKNENMKEAKRLAAKGNEENIRAAKKIYFNEYSLNKNLDAAYNFSVLCLSLNEINEAFWVMKTVCSESDNYKYKELLEQLEKELYYQNALNQ